MNLSANVIDIWVFRKGDGRVEYLLLHTSQMKADRYFNGGRFWQIPCGFVEDKETIVEAIERVLKEFGIEAASICAAEHAYTICNRRFEEMQIIGVYAAEAISESVILNPQEHSEYGWFPFDQSLGKVHFRGLKEGLRSTEAYITGPSQPARELQLK